MILLISTKSYQSSLTIGRSFKTTRGSIYTNPNKWRTIESLCKLERKEQYQNISNAHEEMCMLKNIFEIVYMKLKLCMICRDLLRQQTLYHIILLISTKSH